MTTPALNFASGAQFVTCGDAPTGGLTTLCVEGWFRLLSFSQVNRPLLAKYGAAQEWILYATRDGRLYFVVWTANGVAVAHSAAGALKYGLWTHAAGCVTPLGPTVVINGLDATSVARSPGGAVVDTAQAVRIGGSIGDVGFIGRASWCRISNAARYPGALTGPGNPPAVDANTLCQWNLSEGAGATVDNAEGTAAYDGSITGATWAESVTSDKRRARAPLAGLFGRTFPQGAWVGVSQHG